ncbi:MAG TPA: hypothetical protein VFT59_04360 [Candidatus Saccharimonadales bacterium]|nr:hypothetical protein [Candidatus Saccharimonadales bacterium]
MKTNDPKQTKKNRLNAIIAIASVVIGVAALWLWLAPWVWYDNGPKPLGEKMEYVGKRDYGCWLGFCDSKPGATYYYATDMNVEEVVRYFGKAKLLRTSPADSFHRYSTLEFNTQKADFEIKIYTDKSDESKHINIQEPTKKYMISIPHFDYSVAKEAL